MSKKEKSPFCIWLESIEISQAGSQSSINYCSTRATLRLVLGKFVFTQWVGITAAFIFGLQAMKKLQGYD